jgi:hypothetical protein
VHGEVIGAAGNGTVDRAGVNLAAGGASLPRRIERRRDRLIARVTSVDHLANVRADRGLRGTALQGQFSTPGGG